MADIDVMGQENAQQGICGFTSMMYALYAVGNPGLQQHLSDALRHNAASRFRAEIKTFLKMMEADDRNDILDEIQTFTRTFAGFGGWTLAAYINSINDYPRNQAVADYSIAMPANALLEYIRVMWAGAPLITWNDRLPQKGVIVGLGDDSGLKHYVYQAQDGTFYSWGQRFADLTGPQFAGLRILFYIDPGL